MTASQVPATDPILVSDSDIREPLLVHNTLSLTGWTLTEAGVEAVKVRIGGREYAASHGLPAKEQPAGAPGVSNASRSRFELTLDVSDWVRGEHPFEIVAAGASGIAAEISGVADVQPYASPPGDEASLIEVATNGGTAMWCENPDLAGGEARGQIEVSGWALGAGGVDKVIVTVDGRLRLEALHGLMRPDLRWCFGEELAAGCGFTLRLDRGEAPLGWHDLTVVAVGNDGGGVGVAGTVHCLADEADLAGASEAPVLPGGGGASPNGRSAAVQFMPDRDHGTAREPEHHARYGWAAEMVSGKRVLDAGCGFGWGTIALAEQGAETVGVDSSLAAITEASERHGQSAEFVEADLRRLPFDDGAFDAVVCFETIEQIADPESALDEMRRVLRPGGLLLVSCANSSTYPPGNPLHNTELTSDQLRALIAARFANVAVHYQQTYAGSLLGDEGDLAAADPARLLDARVTKAVGGPPGSELYAVVVASDSELPSAATRIVLGTTVDHDEHLRLSGAWQERAIHAEIDAAASRTETHYARTVQRETLERATAERAALDERSRALEAELDQARERAKRAAALSNGLQQSLSWRMTKPLRALKRVLRRGRPPAQG